MVNNKAQSPDIALEVKLHCGACESLFTLSLDGTQSAWTAIKGVSICCLPYFPHLMNCFWFMLTRCSLCIFSSSWDFTMFPLWVIGAAEMNPQINLAFKSYSLLQQNAIAKIYLVFPARLSQGQCKLPIIFISDTPVCMCVRSHALLTGYLIKIKLMDCLWFINAFHCPRFFNRKEGVIWISI